MKVTCKGWLPCHRYDRCQKCSAIVAIIWKPRSPAIVVIFATTIPETDRSDRNDHVDTSSGKDRSTFSRQQSQQSQRSQLSYGNWPAFRDTSFSAPSPQGARAFFTRRTCTSCCSPTSLEARGLANQVLLSAFQRCKLDGIGYHVIAFAQMSC